MIFQRALRRELVAAAGATFTVLFTLQVTWTLITILGKAAGGRVASNDVAALLAFAGLNYLPTVLILTSFISVLAVVTRTYRESEMVVWFASGQSLVRWVRPVLGFGLPIVAVVAFLSFFATPWAAQKNSEYIERFEKREDLQKVSPGQFKESSSSNRVFFVEGASGETANVQNVFVNTVDEHANTVVVAKEGMVEEDRLGNRFLVLSNGRRYQGVPGQADFQSMEFNRYSMRVQTQAASMNSDKVYSAMPTLDLWQEKTPFAHAEILWRIAAPMMCLLLLLLAIPLGFVNPRAGSSANLIIAILVFLTYMNMVKIMEASVKQGRMPFAASWWPLHLITGLCVLGLFAWRLNVNHRYHPLVLWNGIKHGKALK